MVKLFALASISVIFISETVQAIFDASNKRVEHLTGANF
jgi:hypothetical protein